MDPDINQAILQRKKEWRPAFGQINGSQTHLANQQVKEDDIFLFFGWFKQARYLDGKVVFDKLAPDIHAIFGYLQIGKRLCNSEECPDWLKLHPHMKASRRNNQKNMIYITRETLSWNSSKSGADIFKFKKEVVLTKKGYSRSKWDLPLFFKGLRISHHSDSSWRDSYFKSANIGQEFVIEESQEVTDWAKNIIGE